MKEPIKVRPPTVVLLIIGVCTCIQGYLAQQCFLGLTKDQTFPVCPNKQVTYICTVAGTNYTAWTGSRFFQFCNDTLNMTIITHYYNNISTFANINVSECGPYVATQDDSRTTDGCYVSKLKFIISDPAIFNSTSVECLDGDGKRIGMDTINIAAPPSKPLHLRLNVCDRSTQTLVLAWDKPANNGGSAIVRYGLTVEPAVPQCSGLCYIDANTTQFQIGPLNISMQYTFTVHAENCNTTQQGDQNSITVYYGGPPGPMELSASLIYLDDQLLTIKAMWQEMVPLDIPNQCNLPVIGFEISYISYFSDPVTYSVNLDRCFGGVCSHTFDIVDFDIPMYTLSVSSRNLLGVGPPTVLDFISAKNDFVNITVNASTPLPEAACQFLCGLSEAVAAKCSISYSTNVNEIGQLASITDAPTTNGSVNEVVSFPLTEPLPPNTVYYYQALAFTEDQVVTVKGNFSTGNYSAECDPVQLIADSTFNTNATTCADGNEGIVNKVNNLIVCYNLTVPGSVARLTCSEGNSLEIDGMMMTNEEMFICQVNGLWNHYPTAFCKNKKEYGLIIGSGVGGGALGLIIALVIAAIITFYKYRKSGLKKIKTRELNVAVKYKQGKYGTTSTEEVIFINEGITQ